MDVWVDQDLHLRIVALLKDFFKRCLDFGEAAHIGDAVLQVQLTAVHQFQYFRKLIRSKESGRHNLNFFQQHAQRIELLQIVVDTHGHDAPAVANAVHCVFDAGRRSGTFDHMRKLFRLRLLDLCTVVFRAAIKDLIHEFLSAGQLQAPFIEVHNTHIGGTGCLGTCCRKNADGSGSYD